MYYYKYIGQDYVVYLKCRERRNHRVVQIIAYESGFYTIHTYNSLSGPSAVLTLAEEITPKEFYSKFSEAVAKIKEV